MNDLKTLRLKTGYTQAEIAKKLGITQQAYAQYEKQKRAPDYTTLIKMADIFNVSIDYLLDHQIKKEPDDELTAAELEAIRKSPTLKAILEQLSQMSDHELELAYAQLELFLKLWDQREKQDKKNK